MDKKTAEHIVGWTFVFLAALAAIGGVVIRLADMGAAHPGGGDLATWVGAVATGLAFAGTIWVATDQKRFKSLQRRELAMVAAQGMLPRIIEMSLALGVTQATLESAIASDAGEYDFSEAVRRLTNIQIWANADLVPLAPLPNRCAADLAQAATIVRLIANGMALHGGEVEDYFKPARKAVHGMMLARVKDAIEKLTSAHAECEAAADMRSTFV